MTTHTASGERGFTFVELMFGTVIIAVASIVLISHLAINYNHVQSQRDRVFAYMAAKSILSEIQAYATKGEKSDANDVDSLDDGVQTKPTLSIARIRENLVPPDHELSGNVKRGQKWMWTRQISVQPFKGINNARSRYVTVRIFKRDRNGTEREIANLSSVVNSLAQSFPPTQVFHVYFLAIENIPGWWVHMETVRPFVEAMLTDLERKNPGLTLQAHWITKASYGRDQLYRPFINAKNDSHDKPLGAYYYPGLMPPGNASTYYYVPGIMNARMLTDVGEINGYDAKANPHPYALADFFNHGMRYPQELAFHNRRVNAVRARRKAIESALSLGTVPPEPLKDMSEEPTLRLLFEDMCTEPDVYRNALVMNLHGELVPMPSIRNYSDAAKSPLDLPGVRVVTHPEELRTKRDATGTAHDDAVFRVYAYTTDPDGYSGKEVLSDKEPVLLQVMGVNLAQPDGTLAPGVTLECLNGGVSGSDYSTFAPAAHKSAVTVPAHMYYDAKFVDPGAGREKFTLISLVNTPVVAPLVRNSITSVDQGIANSTAARLYGMEYIPTCTGASLDFSETLASPGTGPKNTARWRLRIGGGILETKLFVKPDGSTFQPTGDVQLTVRTRIFSEVMGPWAGSGRGFPTPNNPDNLSETYTWWADSPEDVPVTERSQFLGDPRHCPYKDLLNGDPDFPNGYNWFFDSLQNGVDVTGNFPGLDKARLRNKWQGKLRQDVPRFFELLRTGLVSSNAVYNTLTGWSYYYMGHGAEIGYDSANGYPNSVPTDLTAFGGGGNGYENNITGARRYMRGPGVSYWWGKPWLGETCPDTSYAIWLTDGNLPPGTGGNKFHQARDEAVYAGSKAVTAGTALYSAYQRLQPTGCGMFFNIGSSTNTFNHTGASGDGTLVGAGLELAANYHLNVPPNTKINRPFSLSVSNDPDGWNFAPHSTNRYTAKLIQTYYTSPTSGYTGSGLVELISPDGKDSGFIVVNGLAQTTELGTRLLAKYSILTMLHSFFESGNTSATNRSIMPPRVGIKSPLETHEIKNPVSLAVKFDVAWTRWDGLAYTGSTAPGFAEAEPDIEYSLLYSRDNGTTWLSMLDETEAEAGVRPTSTFQLHPDSVSGPEIYSWDTPAEQFPQGSYLIRIEAYRQGGAQHYSYDQKRIFIER